MTVREALAWLMPSTPEEFQAWQVVSVIVFAGISMVIANRRKSSMRQSLDVAYIARSTFSGVTLPVSLLLICYPILPQAQAIFADSTVNIYLSVAGVLATMLTLYGLFR